MNKENLELNIIPCVMLIISILIAFATEENTRKVLLIIGAFLLGIQAQKCIDFIKKQKRGE